MREDGTGPSPMFTKKDEVIGWWIFGVMTATLVTGLVFLWIITINKILSN